MNTQDETFIILKYGKPELTSKWLSSIPIEVLKEATGLSPDHGSGRTGTYPREYYIGRALYNHADGTSFFDPVPGLLKTIINLLIEYDNR